MNNPSEWALLDTNILVYADQEEDVHHSSSKHLRELAREGIISCCISPQVLNEFYAVMTRGAGPNRPSHPLSSKDAANEVRKYYQSRNIRKIYPGPNIIQRMLFLLKTTPVTGLNIYDLHLAATMLENGVTKIYTFNPQDFEAIPSIEVLTPSEIDQV